MSNRKRLLSSITVVLLLSSVLSACAKENNGPNASSTTSSTESAGSSGSNARNPIELGLFYNGAWYTFPEWGSNTISHMITEKTGVSLKFTKPNADDNQQFNLMIANRDLPDFVVNDMKNPTYKKAIDAGLFEDLGPLMDQYAPELKQRMGDDYWKMNAAADGKNYTINSAEIRPSNLDRFLPVGPWNPAPLIRQDIYEALGKPKIDTPDDLYNVLLQVKEKYPKISPLVIGNSKFPFTAQPFGYEFFLASFGVEMYYEKDNKLYANYKNPKYLDALKWLNKLYTSGIITRNDIALTDEQRKSIIDSGNVFYQVGSVGTGYQSPENDKSIKYVYAPMFPDATILQQDSIGWAGWSISKTSKHKKEAIQFMSYMMSDEGEKLTHFGIEGKDWKMDNGTPVRTDEYYANIKNDPEYAEKLGMGAYWFNLDLYDHWIEGGEMKKNPEQKEALDLYLPHKNLKLYMLSIEPGPETEEATILAKATTDFNTAFPTFLMAKDEAELEQRYADFIKKMDDMGVPKLEALWSENADKMRKSLNM
ncbi:extracellular solute-binding protein [Paenibacillus sp. GCM10027626]|uniref:extracellular solute-binding protein n=1 Tax=Paenibacillus sp. GCM10027626 TaxID=3273411 RepID=UPI00362B8461